MARESYKHTEIEKSAQALWDKLDLYRTDLTDESKEKYYLLFEFPYPSGDLHIGHWYAFALTDIYARKLRMEGKNVLFPVGFDAFGLPAENAAITRGLDPKKWTYDNMATMRTQMKSMGTSVDWSKEVISCDPSYYKWTQWLFSKLYEHNLAERKLAPVKWCPKDATVLANEQVIDGHCERCGTEVEERNLTQWFFKITNYADRLLSDLDALPWREEIKDAQRAWIGESEGAKLTFELRGGDIDDGLSVDVFTTRPDTLFGATYLVLAPEHPLIDVLVPGTNNEDEIRAYQAKTRSKTERERSENKEKTGVVLEGVTAVNPATKEEIPVFIADYVLASYGTGAVMAVPAHDERDFEFAKKYHLPSKQVVVPSFIDTRNPHVDGKEVQERTGIIAVVRNPQNNTYLCLKWHHADWMTFVTGGTEEGEDVIESARREIQEETGYTDLEFVADLGNTRAEFYASHKSVNRVAYTTTLLFDLKSDAREEVTSEEQAKHTPVWLSREEVVKHNLNHAEFDHIWKRITEGASAYTGDGYLKDSQEFSGRMNQEALWDIAEFAGGERIKKYRLRDWLVSRQRYWGCPIPVVYDPEGKAHLVPKEHLPWLLPEDVDFTPGAAGAGTSPLATSKELKERVTRIFGEGWTPEYDTLDTFVDSSWYFMRYLDPEDENDFTDQALAKRWLPVDRYSGGSEHTTMHLLYARFFYKALYDLALAPTSEPFNERFNRGLILGPDGAKMSKSKGNVVNPDEFVQKYGADAVRMYLAFIGPYNEPGSYRWNLDGVFAMRKFLDRAYAFEPGIEKEGKPSKGAPKGIDYWGIRVVHDIHEFKFNTAIAFMMQLLTELEGANTSAETYRTFIQLLAPFAPHLAEHLWERSGEEGSVHASTLPEFKELVAERMTVTVQINGKKKGELLVKAGASEADVLQMAIQLEPVKLALRGLRPKRVIYVPGRTMNLVPEVTQ